jgi:hypothetical protein
MRNNIVTGVVATLALLLSIGAFVTAAGSNQSLADKGVIVFQEGQEAALGAITSTTKAIIKAAGFITGTSGSTITQIVQGTCTATTAALPAEATSSITMSCAATGVATGDRAFVNLPAQPTSFGSFGVNDVRVTGTDTITFTINNLTGVATSSFPLATTSVKWWAVR